MTILMGFLLLLQQASTLQSTCPDLSGRYVKQSEDGRVYISIKQTRCESIEIDWDGETHVLRLDGKTHRSEEHTSELQSRGHLVCRLLLEKKKKKKKKIIIYEKKKNQKNEKIDNHRYEI